MKLDTLKDYLHQFHSGTQQLFPNVKMNWLTKTEGIDGRWLDERDHLLKNKQGVYIFTTVTSDILYIGKAQESNSDICGRVWAHISTPSTERKASTTRENMIIYPGNKWINNVEERDDPVIGSGQFRIWAVAIEPSRYAALYEIAGLLFHQEAEDSLPRYNARLG